MNIQPVCKPGRSGGIWHGFLFAIAALFLATCAQGQTTQTANVAVEQRLEQAEHRANAAERETQILQAADRIEDAITQQAYNRFEVWTGALISFFSVMIAVLVVVFGFRTEKAAGIAAGLAARQEVAGAKAEIEALLEESKTANSASKIVSAEAQRVLEQALEETDSLSQKARMATASAEASALQADEAAEKARRGADALSRASERNRAEPAETGQPQVILTEQEAKDVKAGAEATSEKPDASRTVDEFKTQIGNAAYVEKNHLEALRLASLMEFYHGSNDDAASFALRTQGDALRALGRQERALGVYADLITRYGRSTNPEIQEHVLWARHGRGLLMVEMLRAVEAEREYRDLIPLEEAFHGPEHTNTLWARQGWARAVLDQGRSAEAEAELRSVLPLRRHLDGDEGRTTLIIRHEIARAMLDQDRAVEAEAELRALVSLKERVGGQGDRETLITRLVWSRSLLRLGRAQQAEAELRALLPLQVKLAGPEHHDTLSVRRALVASMLDQGRAVEAEHELGELRTMAANVYGAGHRETLFVRQGLARALVDQGRTAEAEAELREVLLRLSELEGPGHRTTLTARQDLIRVLLEQARGDEAEAELGTSLPLLEAKEGAEHRLTLNARHQLAIALLEQGRAEEAETQLRALLPAVERVFGADPIASVTRFRLADAILTRGGAEEAAQIIEPIPIDPPRPEWQVRWLAGLAFVRARIADAQGKRESSVTWLEKARAYYAEIYPATHPARQRAEDYVPR